MFVSVIIRTLNESRYLSELLAALRCQTLDDFDLEIVIVDSGSTDKTLDIARGYGCSITHIHKSEFTFGRSLNVGCRIAKGDYLIFISGHCIPVDRYWLCRLIKPLRESISEYTYGRQIGRDNTKFSERCLFGKYFPEYSKIPQEGFYCNNANSAIKRDVWEKYKFDETLTGLEDMHLAKSIVSDGGSISYVADANVFHIHDESWRQVRIRYERESYALRQIAPEIQLSLFDVIRYVCVGVIEDARIAFAQKKFMKESVAILMFRLMQYWGAYKGNHEHRVLSNKEKYKYFYPKDLEKGKYEEKNSGITANESK